MNYVKVFLKKDVDIETIKKEKLDVEERWKIFNTMSFHFVCTGIRNKY